MLRWLIVILIFNLTYIGETLNLVIPREEYTYIMKNNTKKLNKFNKISRDDLIYLAGFIDGDGSILAQITPAHDRLHKFQIRCTVVLYQDRRRAWFLQKMGDILGHGNLNNRNRSNWSWTIGARDEVRDLLLLIEPYLKIKKKLARIVIDIIERSKSVESRADLFKVMQLVDKTAEHTDSKTRVWTSLTAKIFWETGNRPEIKKKEAK